MTNVAEDETTDIRIAHGVSDHLFPMWPWNSLQTDFGWRAKIPNNMSMPATSI